MWQSKTTVSLTTCQSLFRMICGVKDWIVHVTCISIRVQRPIREETPIFSSLERCVSSLRVGKTAHFYLNGGRPCSWQSAVSFSCVQRGNDFSLTLYGRRHLANRKRFWLDLSGEGWTFAASSYQSSQPFGSVDSKKKYIFYFGSFFFFCFIGLVVIFIIFVCRRRRRTVCDWLDMAIQSGMPQHHFISFFLHSIQRCLYD